MEISRQVFLLPPLPRQRDWWMAGACAGLLLGLSELAVGYAEGLRLPGALSGTLLVVSALLVGLPSGVLGFSLRSLGLRLSYSQLVGAILAPLGFAVLARPVWVWIALGQLPESGDLLQLSAGAATVALVSLGAARLGQRGERTGMPFSGPWVWGGAALLFALSTRLAGGGELYSARSLLALSAGVALLGFANLAVFVWAGRRRQRPRASFARTLALTSISAGALCALPAALPWLLYDQDLAVIEAGPPNILMIVLGANGDTLIPGTARIGAGAEAPNLGTLAWNAIAYPHLAQDWVAGAAATLSLPDGTMLPNRLAFSGYAAGAIHRSPDSAFELGIADVDARPSAARALREGGSWLSAAPLLLGPGAAAIEAVGFGGSERSADDVASAARHWLLRWRTTRAPSPFFLLIDMRRANDSQDLEQTDAAFASILECLELLDADVNTTLVVTLENGEDPRRGMAAVLRPPLTWPLPGAGTRAEGKIRAADIAVALLRLSESDGTEPVDLPGVSLAKDETIGEGPTDESDLERWLRANPLPKLPTL